MCESERQVWIQPVVISFPFHVLKQLNLKTAKARVSLCFFWIHSVSSYFDRDLYTGLRFLPPPLWIFHLRWCLIWLFLSSRISSSWRSQVVISRAAPPPPHHHHPPPPHPSVGPCDVWSRARGGRPDIQPRLWRPSLSVPCTLAPCCEAWRKSRSRENYKSPHLLSRG